MDRIAEAVEHHHPVEIQRRHGTFLTSFTCTNKSSIRPSSFHVTKIKPSPVSVFYPVTKDELRKLVQAHSKFRAIGSGHSFRGVLETDGILISLEKMNQIIHVEQSMRQVTVQAGIKIRDVIRILETQYGLALPNMGNYDRQSIGGAICGGTHGTSGNQRNDTFTSAIISIKMINAQGRDIVLDASESVNYGLGGIIYEVTLQVVPFYYLEKKRTVVKDPSKIDLHEWWKSDALFTVSEKQNIHVHSPQSRLQFFLLLIFHSLCIMCFVQMIRWNFPGKNYSVCQKLEYYKKYKPEERNKNKAWLEHFVRLFTFRAAPFAPYLMRALAPKVFKDMSYVDKYYFQYVDDPAPHHTEWEYAVPFERATDLIPLIGDAVKHIPYIVEVHIRVSPQDSAKGHLAYRGDVVWFDLNVVTPQGLDGNALDEIGRPFEDLMTTRSGVAHPHKLVVDVKKAGFDEEKIKFLTLFQKTHDPENKMMNPALKKMLHYSYGSIGQNGV